MRLAISACVLVVLALSAASSARGASLWEDTIDAFGPVGWWRLDEGSGATALDAAGPNDGTYVGGPVLDQDPAFDAPANRSVRFFRGSHTAGDHVAIGDVLDLGTQSFTLLAWFRATSSSESTLSSTMKIVNKGLTNSGTPLNAGYHLRLIDGTIQVSATDAGAAHTIIASAPEPEVDAWHFVAGVLDRASGELRLYLDPVSGTAAATTSFTTLGSLDTNIPLAIGALDRGSFGVTSEFFDGFIDEVVIFDNALSGAQLQQAFTSAVPEPSTFLLLLLGTVALARGCAARRGVISAG